MARQLLEIVRDLPESMSFICKPTTSFIEVFTLGTLFPGPDYSRAKLGVAPVPQSPLKLFKLANPKPSYPASSTHNKCSCPHFPLIPSAFWQALVLHHVAHVVSVPLLLGTVRNKLSFQWQSPPDLLIWPYLSNITYILIQWQKPNLHLSFWKETTNLG